MTTSTDIGTSKTLEFPNAVGRRLAEVAIDRERERQERHSAVEKTLNLFRGERLGRLIDLEDGTQVVEIASKDASRFGVVHGGRLDFRGFSTVDEALLRAVEIRNNGGGSNSQGHVYAARMLGAGKRAEGATP